MKQPGNTWKLVMLTLLMVVSGNAQAWKWITFYPLDAEAIVRFYGTDRRGNNGSTFRDTEWWAGVHLSQRGYIMDPGIAVFLLDIEPVYIGGKVSSDTIENKRDGNFLSYLIQLNLLRGTPGPFGFDFSAARMSNINTVSLGSRYESEIETNSASAIWRNRPFPMRLMYVERTLLQDFSTATSGLVSQRDEKLKTWTLTGRNSKMDLLIERQALDDRVPDRNLDYTLDQATFNHRLPWGRDSQLWSRWNYFYRTGFNFNKRLEIAETARIQHTDNVFSRSIYTFRSVQQFLDTNEHTLQSELVHQLYSNLTSAVRVLGSTLASDNLDETRWLTELRGHYQKSDLVWDATVNAGLAVSYQETDRESRFGLVEIIDEAHTVTFDGMIILNRRFIINATIVVTSADGTVVYTEGVDYITFPLTEDLTQLQVIPGGRINTGETILVSYKAQALPSQAFSTVFTRYNLGFNLGWMSFSHFARISDDKLLSGAGESFLNDYRDITTNLEFRWRIWSIDAVMGAERRVNEVRSFKTTNYSFRQFFSWEGFGNTLWNLNMTESFGQTDTIDTELYNLELSVSWQPLMGLQIRPVIGAWKRRDEVVGVANGRRDDSFITAGFTLRWVYRKVLLDLGYHINRRTTNANQIDENRLMFNLRRRF